jgi:hypothetical protein
MEARMKPRIFIGSAAEHLDLAYAAQENLEHDLEVTVWSQGVFGLSKTSMASLIDELDATDFALFILTPSDVTAIRDKTEHTVRDNVIFELGLFIGHLGSDRCFVVVPRGVEDLHLPTDLVGLTPATYEPDRQDNNLTASLGPACNRVRKSVVKLGSVKRTLSEPAAATPSAREEDLCSDPGDCIALIQSWMGARATTDNRRAMRYDDVDRELKLAPGAARLYLEQAAHRWGYVVAQKGKDVILFKDEDYRI